MPRLRDTLRSHALLELPSCQRTKRGEGFPLPLDTLIQAYPIQTDLSSRRTPGYHFRAPLVEQCTIAPRNPLSTEKNRKLTISFTALRPRLAIRHNTLQQPIPRGCARALCQSPLVGTLALRALTCHAALRGGFRCHGPDLSGPWHLKKPCDRPALHHNWSAHP